MGIVSKRAAISFPKGKEPNVIIPSQYCSFRYLLGKSGSNPLVCIGMNPSAASDNVSDRTVNKVINAASRLGYDGWFVLNLYPERGTNSLTMEVFNQKIHNENLKVMEQFIKQHHIKEVFIAWGDQNHKNLSLAKNDLINTLISLNVKLFTFWELTKNHNPSHPLYKKNDSFSLENKQYIDPNVLLTKPIK